MISTIHALGTRRIVVCCIVLVIFVLAFSSQRWQTRVRLSIIREPNVEHTHEEINEPLTGPAGSQLSDPRCDAFPDPGNIAIALKTGATEASEKIPMVMLTTLRCAQNVMIFSDLEQTVAGYKVHDALDRIPASVMEGNPDFDFYHKQKEVLKYGQIERMMKGVVNPRKDDDSAAWTLDKYKQLHLLEKLYEAYPNKDWYFVMDADTYLVWPSFFMWLQKLPSPSKKQYYGAPARSGELFFAHGGSGILLSHGTLYDLAVNHNGTASRWDSLIENECCGDLVIARVLKEIGIDFQTSWPISNGESPLSIRFGKDYWCQPVVTMHHVATEQFSELMNFELSRDVRKPFLYVDLYNKFVKGILPESLEDWDNENTEVVDESVFVESFEECQSQCQLREHCFQYAFSAGECQLGKSIHLGHQKKAENGRTFRSGWLNERINTWVENHAPCRLKSKWTG